MQITIRPGVTMTLTAPCTYQMTYLNGSRTYTEPFIVTHFDKASTDQSLKPYRTMIDGLAAFFLGAGAATGGPTLGITTAMGAILALVTKVAGPLIENTVFHVNGDGSVDLMTAYHFWGCKDAMGVDPTAWPIPGVDAQTWFGNVNGLLGRFRNNLAADIKAAKKEPLDRAAASGQTLKKAVTLQIAPGKSAGSPAEIKLGEADFWTSFSECLGAQNLPVPANLFGTATAAIASINALYGAVASYGTSVTISELIGAGFLSDAFAVAGSLTGAYYLGALIGCGIRAGIGPYIPAS